MIKSFHILNSNRILPSSKNIISDFLSAIWTVDYYGTGDFQIVLPATSKNISVFTDEDNQYVARQDDENVGVIENILLKRSRDNPTIEIKGRFIKSILDRRIVGNASVLDQDMPTGKATYNNIRLYSGEKIENIVRQLVFQCFMYGTPGANPRNVSFMQLGPNSHTSQTLSSDRQTTGSNLLDFTDSLLEEYGLGAKLLLDNETKNFLYVVYQGSNKTSSVIFSPKLSNFRNTEKSVDYTNYKNVALIGGQGEGADRFYALLNWYDLTPHTPYMGITRREVFIDARDQSQTYIDGNGQEASYTDKQYHDMLVQRGKNRISSQIIEDSYSGEIVRSNHEYKYRTDYNVGDICTVASEDGVTYHPRIVSVTESQDSDNGYSVFPTLSNE